MNTLAERIHEADRHDTIWNIKTSMRKWWEKERREFLAHLVRAGDVRLLQEFFWIESTDILEPDFSIAVPEEKRVFAPYTRDVGDLQMRDLSKKELSFLLQAFFPDTKDREYIIDMIFYRNNFLTKTLVDVMDFMDGTEELFASVCSTTRKRVLHVVTGADCSLFEAPEAANDERFVPIPERIDPKWYEYGQKVHELRLEYMESLFCQMVARLADTHANRLWAMYPEHFTFTVPEDERSHIELIASICEFHRIVQPDFPNLATMLQWAVASWILVYQGFSAHAHDARERVRHQPETLV